MKCRVNSPEGYYDGHSFHREDAIVDWEIPGWAKEDGLSEKQALPPCLTPVKAGIDEMGKPGLVEDEGKIEELEAQEDLDVNAQIEDALKKLDHEDNSHWTARGLPELSVVRKLVGNDSIDRAMIKAVAPGFEREKQ